MKKIYIILACLLFSIDGFSQEKIDFKEYSYSEFFKMIEEEPSETFTLKNAAIVFDSITDMAHATLRNGKELLRKDTIIINKKLVLENIFFNRSPIGQRSRKYREQLYFIKFQKEVRFTNCFANINHCVFKEQVRINFNDQSTDMRNSYVNRIGIRLLFENSHFKNGMHMDSGGDGEYLRVSFGIEKCQFWPLYRDGQDRGYFFNINTMMGFFIENTTFYGNGDFNFYTNNNRWLDITSNDFTNLKLSLWFSKNERLSFFKNTINQPTGLDLGVLSSESVIDWDQFNNSVYAPIGLSSYRRGLTNKTTTEELDILTYLNKGKYTSTRPFKLETKLLGKLQGHYKVQHDKEYENAVFIEIKNLETQRLQYLYEQNPSFDRYFKWKVNQFLKVFSAYGTEPSKAITFSVYVILLFALIYLFFPNHWDSHGKNRIMDRYRFFTKYMNKEAGIHEVYLEEQKEELLASEDFKIYMLKAEKTIPKFFTATALPLYKWAISGTKISSSFLSKIDIMKGTWSDLPKSKRIWKSILLIGAFLIAVLYDVFIKMLNALMLSINTFTTLGFGEIPIKGLPRYLAIIQGFIGWFMLTIFSVSLISQLLN